jgi:hypothetical protein
MEINCTWFERISGKTREILEDFRVIRDSTLHAYDIITEEKRKQYLDKNIRQFFITSDYCYVIGQIKSEKYDQIKGEYDSTERTIQRINAELKMSNKLRTNTDLVLEKNDSRQRLIELRDQRIEAIILDCGRKEKLKQGMNAPVSSNTINAIERHSQKNGYGILYLPTNRDAITRLMQDLGNFSKEEKGCFFAYQPKLKVLEEVAESRFATIQ